MSMAAKRPPALDRIDIKILAALQREGRATMQTIADTVGLTPRPALERVRRLEAAGIIAGYQAVLALERVSRPVTIYAVIGLEKHGRQDRFERHLTGIDEVVECWEISGEFDYLARFVCRDLVRYEELTADLIDHQDFGIARIVSHITLRAVRRFSGYPESLLSPREV
jgi:Lrp/AsnC family transcriptional regulator, regulator of ectoine-degradation genes